MQISPSPSLLQAISGSSSQVSTPAGRPQRPNTSEAAREAARAVFAQLKAPVPGTPASATAVQTQTNGPSIPTQPPRRPLPRGSIINILV
ncbi:MAG TPA: hypothetical protein VGB82_08885 [Alphaproteobacteria bacterium]